MSKVSRTGTVTVTNFTDLHCHQRTIFQVAYANPEISIFVQEVHNEIGEKEPRRYIPVLSHEVAQYWEDVPPAKQCWRGNGQLAEWAAILAGGLGFGFGKTVEDAAHRYVISPPWISYDDPTR